MLAHVPPTYEQGVKEGDISPLQEFHESVDQKSFKLNELEESKISNSLSSKAADKVDVTIGDAPRVKSVTIDIEDVVAYDEKVKVLSKPKDIPLERKATAKFGSTFN